MRGSKIVAAVAAAGALAAGAPAMANTCFPGTWPNRIPVDQTHVLSSGNPSDTLWF